MGARIAGNEPLGALRILHKGSRLHGHAHDRKHWIVGRNMLHTVYPANGAFAPRMATWRSGYASDCKSAYPGSIPGVASRSISLIELIADLNPD